MFQGKARFKKKKKKSQAMGRIATFPESPAWPQGISISRGDYKGVGEQAHSWVVRDMFEQK